MKSFVKDQGNDDLTQEMFFNPYAKAARSPRTGSLFYVHPYPTKINHTAIMPFILAHTKPGDTVYDSFAGTCSTGFAAAACAKPNDRLLKDMTIADSSRILWGARKAVCVDLGALPTFIGRTLLREIDVDAFAVEFSRVMSDVENKWGWIYETHDEKGNSGVIRHSFYSDLVRCPHCGSEHRYIDLFVDFDLGMFRNAANCASCGAQILTKNAPRVSETVCDDLLHKERLATKRVPVRIYGKIGSTNWVRESGQDDIDTLRRIDGVSLEGFSKPVPILSGSPKWGEMHRSGYHSGITHLHHFYTRRNYLALSVLYDASRLVRPEFRDHFLLLISSYNTSHSSLMTRFVFKKNSRIPVVTSGQPGALYVSGCPVEKNVFLGVRRKLNELCAVSKDVLVWKPKVYVFTRAAQHSGLEDNSIDYIFTDPPFGGNIQYSELNFLSEAWIGTYTDNKHETIISRYQSKDLEAYESLLADAFRENYRVLKPGRYMTVVFHTRRDEIWRALQHSVRAAGFEIVDSSILDKQQTSFKQTLTSGAVKKDPIIVARKPVGAIESSVIEPPGSTSDFIRRRLSALDEADSIERSFDYLFSRYMGQCLASGQEVKASADDFRQELSRVAKPQNGSWYLRESMV